MTNIVTTMSPIVKKFFSTHAEKTARETTFVQRRSKMTGSRFLKTFVLGLLEHATASLNDLSEFCEDHCGITISVQALDERIHHAALLFMKQMFRLALVMLRQTIALPIPLLSQFSAVTITDSTGVSLPETLAEEFPGSGGACLGLRHQTAIGGGFFDRSVQSHHAHGWSSPRSEGNPTP